jgi:hypothetical protein
MLALDLQAAGRPISMSHLAAAAGCSPRMTTYHAVQPEAAGLVVWERRGQSVWVSRTARGYELVELLSTERLARWRPDRVPRRSG